MFAKPASAFTPTDAQIEQFLKLPKSQQEQIAKQFGVDLDQFKMSALSGGGSNTQRENQETDQYYQQPRAPYQDYKPTTRQQNNGAQGYSSPPSRQYQYNQRQGQREDYQMQDYSGQRYPDENNVHQGRSAPDSRSSYQQVNPYYRSQQEYPDRTDSTFYPLTPDSPYQQRNQFDSDNPSLEQKFYSGMQHQSGELRSFGYELFQNNFEAFVPNSNVPVPLDYIVGPGDSFTVQLYGKENSSYDFTINRDGFVQFPEIGPVSVAGLSFGQVQDYINKTVSEQMIGVKSSVTMGALRSMRVFVLGEANQPGSYVVSSLSTMTNALFSSGGVRKIGSLRNIQLKRKGKVIATLDLYDLLLRGDTANDSRLAPGDVIFIPPIGKTVSVDGEVRRPAIYEVKNETSAQQAVQLAGGLLPTAYPKESRIDRINEKGERTVVNLDLSSKQGAALPIRKGDVLTVFSVLDSKQDIVELQGHVKRPGIMAWKQGMRVTDVLGDIYNLKPNPDLSVAMIEREVQPSRKLEVLTFDLGAALINPLSEYNVKVKPRDKITVFNYTDPRAMIMLPIIDSLRTQASQSEREQVVKIGGFARFPGEYPLIRNMTPLELIALAGGLTQDAYSLEVEITRYTLDEHENQEIKYLNVELDDTAGYVLQRQDYLNVKRLPDWSPEETITLEGEITFPGTYTIKKGETLREVLLRAGGLTEQAYPKGAVFTRSDLQVLEAQRLEELKNKLKGDIAASNIAQQESIERVGSDDAENLLESLGEIKPLGRMVINLPEIVNKPEAQDILIADGDTLNVPGFKQSVTVVGEVQYPTSHLFNKKYSVEEYIDRSGGLNTKADDDRIYVVKADGSVLLPKSSGWFARKSVSVEPGDTVVVPLDADRIKSLTLWTSVSQIFYQIALGAAAVNSF
ncbi:SLBB domain-containing protein [Ketobacter sp.]